MIDRTIVDPKTVQKTVGEWIKEEGSASKVSRRIGLDHAVISKAYHGKMKITTSRWEKWKILWRLSGINDGRNDDFDDAMAYAKILAKNELNLRGINQELNAIGYKIVIVKKDSGQ